MVQMTKHKEIQEFINCRMEGKQVGFMKHHEKPSGRNLLKSLLD